MPEPATMCAAFQRTAASQSHRTAVRSSDGRISLRWSDYADEVRRIAGGLAALGVSRGDSVALMLTNRPEFFVADLAAMHLGATVFSIYNTSSVEQIRYLLDHADPAAVICEQRFAEVIRAAGGTERVLCVEDGDLDGLRPAVGFDFESTWRAVDPDDVLFLIYTSGTTGPPKGVEMTHRGMLALAGAIATEFEFRPGDRALSYLPAAHVAERAATYYPHVMHGTEITTVADMTTVSTVLTDVRPDVWGGVPRIWEKAKDGVEAKLAASPLPARLAARWAIGVGRAVARHQVTGQQVPFALAAWRAVADRLVLSRVRRAMGMDRVRWAVTGSATTPNEVFEFMRGIGIPLTDVWGMSEIGMVTAAAGDAARPGTVGRPLPGAEVRIMADGEIHVRCPWMMRGYRNDPERTAETVDADGWLHTGDLFTQDADGYLRIIGRKKELIINAGGKNMSPNTIQQAISAEAPLIGWVVAAGDGRPYNVALIVLDPEESATFAETHGLSPDPGALAKDPRVIDIVRAAVEAGNAKLSRVEQIKRYAVLPTYWEPGRDEVTLTMKLRRKDILERYADRIDELYRTRERERPRR
ncbi:AMP-binding protein [Nocardia sp. CA-136227]|uniref:AMP-binding protein n=1 Tax=Nocardia sp. CA-136227 TaxID=3239979 RepID=UPI003D960ED9